MRPIGSVMKPNRTGQIAVIFCSVRTEADAEGYGAAAEAMGALAAQQPGYCGVTNARGSDGFGITVSYWSDEVAAKAWRDQPDHTRIRELGRGKWYASYTLEVAEISRSYEWMKDD
jgi:heme-degrading monooxygenase HmoA